ncbi:MAG TPA: hypothetical protein VKV33_01200 [Streptosporangiaceae bacterium]|nr:hypothetical protein [Streptosporangiaceae bacterium]
MTGQTISMIRMCWRYPRPYTSQAITPALANATARAAQDAATSHVGGIKQHLPGKAEN